MYELHLPAKLEHLDQVIAFVDEHLERCDCPMNIRMQVTLAVEEIYVNIAHYAYAPEVGPATIQLEIQEDSLEVLITFMDHGKPYDPTLQPDPDVTLSAEDRNVGGLGIFMVKKSMDGVSYEYANGQNVLTIKKHW